MRVAWSGLLLVGVVAAVAAQPRGKSPDETALPPLERFQQRHQSRLGLLTQQIEAAKVQIAKRTADPDTRRLMTAYQTELQAVQKDPFRLTRHAPVVNSYSVPGAVGLMPALTGKVYDVRPDAMRVIVEYPTAFNRALSQLTSGGGGVIVSSEGDFASTTKTMFSIQGTPPKDAKAGATVSIRGVYEVTAVDREPGNRAACPVLKIVTKDPADVDPKLRPKPAAKAEAPPPTPPTHTLKPRAAFARNVQDLDAYHRAKLLDDKTTARKMEADGSVIVQGEPLPVAVVATRNGVAILKPTEGPRAGVQLMAREQDLEKR